MTDSMSDQNVSDALTGIDIEQSLKNKFSTIGFADFQSEQTDIGNLRDLDDLGDNIPTIASESSGVISGSPSHSIDSQMRTSNICRSHLRSKFCSQHC